MNDTTLTIEFSKNNPYHILTFNNITNGVINIYVKSSGYIEKDFFTADYRFLIDADKLIIKDIFFVSIMKHNDNSESEKIFDIDDFTENYFEHKIYNFLKNTLEKSVLSIDNNNLTLKITLFSIEYYLMRMTYNIEDNVKNNLLTNLDYNNASEQVEEKEEKEEKTKSEVQKNYLNNNSISTSATNEKLSTKNSSSKNSSIKNSTDDNLSNEDNITESSETSDSSDLESSEHIKTEPEILKLLMWGSIISFTSHLFQEKVNVKTKK